MKRNYRIQFIAFLLGHYRAEHNQTGALMRILRQGRNTQFGKDHQLHKISSVQDYLQNDLLTGYDDLYPYLQRIMNGEQDVSFKGKPDFMAITSGTTAYAKYIPLRRTTIRSFQYGSLVTLINLILETGKLTWGKSLFISPPTIFERSAGIIVGRIPAILNDQLSDLQKKFIYPTRSVLNIPDNDLRQKAIIEECREAAITSISGMPSWLCSFFQQVEALTQLKPIQLWPKLKYLFVGGTSAVKYKDLLSNTVGKKIDLVSSYIATEGFLGIGCDVNAEQYLLNLKNGTFYEFIPAFPDENEPFKKYGIQDVSVGVEYNLVLTDAVGKWSYNVKDVIRFSCLKPYIFEVLGRSNNEISIAGEHLLEAQVQKAISNVKDQLQLQGIGISEYIIRGLVTDKGPTHQWAIEISTKNKESIGVLEKLIDGELQKFNYMYKNLRHSNQLKLPEVIALSPGTFRKFFVTRQKIERLYKLPAINADPAIWEYIKPN
ncbi:MAG: GH3 auxin-responsive promoter family protein [Saprospiraceae bacterium]|nr:GH3 auxin-responsive promoter family protein [Lewinella sp.]